MTAFWFISGALAVAASLFVALPLMKNHTRSAVAGSGGKLNVSVYRDQLDELDEDRRTGRLDTDQYDEARGEIERRLVEDLPDAQARAVPPARRRPPAVAIAAGMAVPLLAGFLYIALGNPASMWPQARPNTSGAHQLDAAIGQLAARLQKNPEDGKGWIMLARSQAVLGRFGEASTAYARTVALFPDDAQLLADYADTLAMTQGGRLAGEPEKLVERALRADPDNGKALALAGTIAFERKDYARAVNHWQRVKALIPADSKLARSIQAGIAEAKRLADSAVRREAGALGGPGAPARR
ncbi:MAG: c-type cytochrome biogenesis protein CcmI [Betaproteobacteria bacterium RIFCSPLOWO2_02_FULL_63_19]|nr:MAG: c-type cytochrome biogenesis protein CcmI [Betaproteobacteria bacterium RIFCSPLOWO2_02_FULL_63_19]